MHVKVDLYKLEVTRGLCAKLLGVWIKVSNPEKEETWLHRGTSHYL